MNGVSASRLTAGGGSSLLLLASITASRRPGLAIDHSALSCYWDPGGAGHRPTPLLQHPHYSASLVQSPPHWGTVHILISPAR